ncbi:MAG: hypothetical protein QOJ64_3750 [Acidobacteriota bacterium]|jgi:hypothetical protein|nr:hypothetical protein [Acidobacteriota bacterium]
MHEKLKPILFGALLVAAVAFMYRIVTDAQVSSMAVAGLIAVSALAIITLLSGRLTEFSAGSKGVSAKLSQLDKNVSEIKTFLFGSIDDDSLATLQTLSAGQLSSPDKPDERNELKSRLRTLRKTSLILRDETKCDSISDAVKMGGNISHCFKLTRMATDLLQTLKNDQKPMT